MAQPSAAPQQNEVASACERVCGVPCNLQVATDRATQQRAAVDGALLITQEEVAHWDHGMAFHASALAAFLAALTAAAARDAVAALKGVRRRQPRRKRRLLAKPAPPRRPWPRRRRR